MKLYDAKTSFASGELSPTMFGRVDLGQYGNGAKELTNFIVLPQGGIINRPGTTSPKSGGNIPSYGSAILIPFVYSEDDSGVLAIWFSGIYFYKPDGSAEQIWDSSHPYAGSHFKNLRWLQSGNAVYLFHPNVPTRLLMRTANGWTLDTVEFENGPFEDINTDPDKKLYVGEAGGGLFISSMFDMKDIMYKGQLLKIETEVKAYAEELSVSKGDSNDEFGSWVEVSKPVFGAFTFRTSGRWTGKLEVERKRPDMNWEPFKTYASEPGAEENFSFSGTAEEYAHRYRFRYKGGNASLTVNFNFEGGLVNRVFRVKSFTVRDDGQVREAKVLDIDGNKETLDYTDAWYVGSFGPNFGYPSMGIFHQERLILANTRHSPQTIWMSQPASWHNFNTSIPAKDDDAITVTLASKQIDEIRGLASRGDLLIFTEGGEWTAKAGSKSDVFTPSSIVITPSGYRGSANVAPLDVGDVTMFLQRPGTTVRSIGYSLDVDGYASNDISLLAEHMFRNNPVKAWAYQQTPWSVVWCVLNDGSIAALTFQKEHQVCAWSRHRLGSGSAADVCCIPGTTQDEVYFLVKNGNSYHVERLNHRDVGNNAAFSDNGTTPVRCAAECLDWERPINDGTIQGRHKHMPVATFRLLETRALRGGVITENSSVLDNLPISGLYTGDVRLNLPGGMGRTCRLRLECDAASPVGVLGIFPEIVLEPEGTNE